MSADKAFEDFVRQWTGRDVEYHKLGETTGMEFGRDAYLAGRKAALEEVMAAIKGIEPADEHFKLLDPEDVEAAILALIDKP